MAKQKIDPEKMPVPEVGIIVVNTRRNVAVATEKSEKMLTMYAWAISMLYKSLMRGRRIRCKRCGAPIEPSIGWAVFWEDYGAEGGYLCHACAKKTGIWDWTLEV